MTSYHGELSIGSLSLRRRGSNGGRAFKYRDRLTIFVAILRSAGASKKGRTKTQILQSANLNYHQVTKYLGLLLESGYLMHDGGRCYRVTDEGWRFAKTFESLDLRLT